MIGKIIKSYRIKNKYTQRDLADEIGVMKSAITKWESGKETPSNTHLNKIVKILNIPKRELKGKPPRKVSLTYVKCNDKYQDIYLVLNIISYFVFVIGIAVIITYFRILFENGNYIFFTDCNVVNNYFDKILTVINKYLDFGGILILSSLFLVITAFFLKHFKVNKREINNEM